MIEEDIAQLSLPELLPWFHDDWHDTKERKEAGSYYLSKHVVCLRPACLCNREEKKKMNQEIHLHL